MGRPEPYVLFAQTFVHPQLDEYVDEVMFAEPVVVTACEFLEQNATSTFQAVPLVGATSPPSFALEVFVHCEGETRFRRLCQPFLYSHSSSNVLEVEAVVTNHLIVRGSYRSISLVIYGNKAEDLGQFNIEFDDNSLTNLVSSADGKLEDLPLALRTINRTFEESLYSLNVLSLPVKASDISVEVKQFLQILLKLLELPNVGSALHKVVTAVASAASSYVSCDVGFYMFNQKPFTSGKAGDSGEVSHVVNETREELLELYESLQIQLVNESAEPGCTFMESVTDLISSKQLVEILYPYCSFNYTTAIFGHHQLTKSKRIMLGLGVAVFLCSSRESCFHFVNCGGMDQIAHLFSYGEKSTTITLLLLGVIEQATRHSIGCEGYLGWWPREDESIPSGTSDRYGNLLRLLLQKPRHDVASLATYILHRLRFYEVASRYEWAVLSILGRRSASGGENDITTSMLIDLKSQLKKLLHLINSRGPMEDPSPVACASRSLLFGQTEGLLSYKATGNLLATSNCCFSNWDNDFHLLSLLKDRGFLSLSAAMLSTSVLHLEIEDFTNLSMDITSSIGAIFLSLLFCRPGLVFLLHHPELTTTVIHALKGADNLKECVPLRYARVLMSKGFTCGSWEIGMIMETHLRVVSAVDRLLGSTPHSEEFLWVLWELCGLSRSDCGRQALLALSFFPEALSVLIEALHSVKESEPAITDSGATPVNLAILHSAAEILEVIVTDSTASSLSSWIGHSMELHKALHSSSPGSNRKDTPTRLLEWIDAGLVYHKNGGVGLLRYAALLASGGDAHSTSTSILGSDLADVENAGGESSNPSDANVMENLGRIISDKSFDGVTLRDSSIAQLTTAFRILAFISENSTVAAALYDEGAIAVIYVVLVNCSFMLERSSSSYDYLVDEGTECNSTSDLLLERNREKSLVDLLVPSLVLLITLLQKLQEAKEQHRNTKLMKVLLRLHREVSPKLAACAADLSSPNPDSALGFGAVCHLVVSALAFWSVYGWTPGLFHSLLASVQANSSLALGPKETCSLLCLLNDLFPDEGVWLWKNGMPMLSGLRTLAVGTLLGPQKEKQVDWYQERGHLEKLLNQLTPQLDKIAQIIQHYAVSALVVIQDMLRVFIIRIACQKAEHACKLLRPILSGIRDCVSETPSPSVMDTYKVYRFLDFLASLLEHPKAKALLLGEGIFQVLIRVLERCFDATCSDDKQISDDSYSAKFGLNMTSWCIPVFRCISLLCNSRTQNLGRHKSDSLSTQDCSLFVHHLLKFCQVLPVGKELLSCLTAFKDLASSDEGCSALSVLLDAGSNLLEPESERTNERDGKSAFQNDSEWRKCPPLFCCWTKLFRSVNSLDDSSAYAVEAVAALSFGSLSLCVNGESLNPNAVVALKFLFGLIDDSAGIDGFPEENMSYIQEFSTLLTSRISNGNDQVPSNLHSSLDQVSEYVKKLLLVLQKPIGAAQVDDVVLSESHSLPPFGVESSQIINPMAQSNAEKSDDQLYLVGFGDKFFWELPETLPERLSQGTLPMRRRMPPADGSNKRARGDNSGAEIPTQSTFSRGMGSSTAPTGPNRRDTFRQRKPNTSRPPSMHVDDYVARERSVDGASNSNVIAVQRMGSGGGRPPSIHVDEFMARQRERQNPGSTIGGDTATQPKNVAPGNDADAEKVNKSKQLKTDLDDDLQGIDIVFDGEESETDDRLPFPQPDDNLQQPASVMVEQSSPHSVVEETESEVNGSSHFSQMGTPIASNNDENAQSEFSSRMSVSRPDIPLHREPSISSDKKFFEQSDETRNATPVRNSSGFDSVAAANSSGFPAPPYSNTPQLPPHNFYPKSNSQYGSNVHGASRGIYDQKVLPNQPPLPPMPPPSAMSQVQSDYKSGVSNSPMLSRTSMSSPSGSARPPPPLPSTPPPFSSSPYNLSSLNAPNSQMLAYNQTNAGTAEHSHSSAGPGLGNFSASGYPPPMMPPSVFGRPASIPLSLYGNTIAQQQGENPLMQNPSMHSLAQLPLQQLQRPLQPAQQLRPPMQPPQQLDQGVQMQMHSLQMLQQPQVPAVHSYYQSQQQEFSPAPQQSQSELAKPQVLHQQGSSASQQQQDPGMSLHEYFQSPEAIQSLLSDRDKLCQLLEQHPKLMQMLQEKLGQT